MRPLGRIEDVSDVSIHGATGSETVFVEPWRIARHDFMVFASPRHTLVGIDDELSQSKQNLE